MFNIKKSKENLMFNNEIFWCTKQQCVPKICRTMSLACHSSCSYLFMLSCLGPGQRVSWSSEDFGFHEVLGFLRYPVSLLFSPRRVFITLQDNEWKINFQEINEALQVNTLTTWNTLSLSLEEYMTYGARIEHE